MSTLHGEYRRHSRTNLHTQVSINAKNQQHNVKTRDLSQSGLSVAIADNLLLEIGQTINVTFNNNPGYQVFAKVVRINEHGAGLELQNFRLTEADINGIINNAPLLERLKVNTRRALWKFVRRSSVFITNTILRKPMLALIKPSFLFAVYGNKKDVGTYFTPFMSRFMPPLMLGSIIKLINRRGLMVASMYYESELAEDPEKVRAYLDQLKEEFPDVKTIALVGRLPNFVMKAGRNIESPYVDGSMGTRYMIWDCACHMRDLPGYKEATTITVLGGAGRIGNKVCEDLAREYHKVIAFDSRYNTDETIYTPSGNIIRTSNPSHFSDCHLYISLTHHGDVISDFMNHIPSGALVADDTHPCISLPIRKKMNALNIKVLKTVLHHKEFSMWPRMPAWSNRAIPGCLVEALVLLESETVDVAQFNSFCNTAKNMGFHGQLVKPLDE